jgi:hypothetical protein
MSKNDKIEFEYLGKGSYSDSRLKKGVKEGEKIYVNQSQVGYLKKIKINGENIFKETEQSKKEEKKPEKKSYYGYKKEQKDELDNLND